MSRIVLLGVLALAVAAPPVQAKAPKAQKCQPHAVAYEVSGTVVSGSLTANSDGSYSGILTVHVTKAEHHAKADKGMDKSYTLDHAKVKLHGENPVALTANSRAHLNGTITTLAKKCDHTGFTPTVTIKKADIKPPKTH
jgi:hypothetical protein